MIDEATAFADALSGVIREHLTPEEFANRPSIWMEMGMRAARDGHRSSRGVRTQTTLIDGTIELKWVPPSETRLALALERRSKAA